MPFLAGPIGAAIAGGAASAGVGALGNALMNHGGGGPVGPQLGSTQLGGNLATDPVVAQQLAQEAENLRKAGFSELEINQSQKNEAQKLGLNSQQLINPLTGADVRTAMNNTQGGIDASAQLIQQAQAQNGLGNQSSVFNQQQALANQLAGANAVGGQTQLAQQLQAQAQGGGPNPAAAMLANQTAANTANQAALMASQRGAGANAGLLARNAAMVGAQNQQNAIGQGAVMQANQQLAAQNALQNLYGSQLSAQQNQQNMLGGLAGQQAQNYASALQNFNAAAQGNQGQLLSGVQGQNQNLVNLTNAQTGAQGQIAAQNNAASNQFMGNMLGAGAQAIGTGLSQAISPAQKKWDGGVILPDHFQSVADIYHTDRFKAPSLQDMAQMYGGGRVNMVEGGKVPGKAKMKGDHPENDTVPAKLSPGEVVLPKSVMESQDPVSAAAQFVAAIQKKKGNPQADFKEALARAMGGKKK